MLLPLLLLATFHSISCERKRKRCASAEQPAACVHWWMDGLSCRSSPIPPKPAASMLVLLLSVFCY